MTRKSIDRVNVERILIIWAMEILYDEEFLSSEMLAHYFKMCTRRHSGRVSANDMDVLIEKLNTYYSTIWKKRYEGVDRRKIGSRKEVSAEDRKFIEEAIAHYFKMNEKIPSPKELGNNLRILRKLGVVRGFESGSRRSWELTGVLYEPEEFQNMLLPIPKSIHDMLRRLAKLAGVSMTAFAVDVISRSVLRRWSQRSKK